MSQTLSSYVTLVQNEVEDTSSRAKVIIERAVKDTYQEVLNFVGDELAGIEEEDITATVSQRYVTPVNSYQDFKKVLYSTDGNNFETLTPITEEDYYERYINIESSTPQHFYLVKNDIYFDVAPNEAGTVKVAGIEIQDELEGAVVSLIPDRFTQVIVKGSVAHFKAYEGVQDAREYFKIYRGPYFEQGKTGGILMNMINQLKTRRPTLRPKLYNR